MKYIKRYGYSVTLGMLLPLVANLGFTDWQFYAIMAPIIILVEWKVGY